MTAADKATARRPKKAKPAAPEPKASRSRTANAASETKASVSDPAPAAQTAVPTIVEAPVPMIAGPSLRKKEIIEEAVQRSGMKRRDVKPMLDILLGIMGEGLAEGRELVIPPFGRIKVHRHKTTPKKKIFFAKVHQNIPPDRSGTVDKA